MSQRTTTAFRPFELEHWQSQYEQVVAHNLADSSADSMALRELVGAEDLPALLDLPLHYPEVNGESRLRDLIAGLAGSGATRDNVLVTVGAAQANAVIVETLAVTGSNVVVMEPGYRQVAGTAANRGIEVRAYQLAPDRDWSLDLEQLAALVDDDTSIIYVCNPNNPTGKVLDDADLDAIVAIADQHDAIILADEVYQGSERSSDRVAHTLWGRSERVVVVNSLSKSYGLSGLRIGWVVGPADLVTDLWRRHEYLVISAGRVDNLLASFALTEPRRAQLLERNLRAVGRGWEELEAWAARNADVVHIPRPDSTGLAFVRYDIDLPSEAVADAIRLEGDVLVAPGTYFGLDGWFRLNFGFAPEVMRDALGRIEPVLHRLRREHGAGRR